MVLVTRINERDEWPSIDKNQRPLLRRLRSAAKVRPVCSERFGFPPLTTPIRSFIAS